MVRTLSPSAHFGSPFFGHRQVEYGFYRPLVSLSLALDHGVGGGRPWLFHLTHLLLHGLNGFLLYLLIRRFAGPALAGLAAGLFLAALAGGLLSKESAVTFPAVLLAAGLAVAMVDLARIERAREGGDPGPP